MIIDTTPNLLHITVTDLGTRVVSVMAAIERNSDGRQPIAITLPSGHTLTSDAKPHIERAA